jgi:zinc D-Ala-D-Ala carboxypeptidase
MADTMTCPRCWGVAAQCALCSGKKTVPDRTVTPHFRLSELVASETARSRHLANDPTPEVMAHLQQLCDEALEPIRALVGPLKVNSAYRSVVVNGAVGGSKTSAHCHGLAADLRPIRGSVKSLMDAIVCSPLKFDQVIYENPSKPWVHVGLLDPKTGGKRGQLLSMFLVGGKPTYEPFKIDDGRLLA